MSIVVRQDVRSEMKNRGVLRGRESGLTMTLPKVPSPRTLWISYAFFF